MINSWISSFYFYHYTVQVHSTHTHARDFLSLFIFFYQMAICLFVGTPTESTCMTRKWRKQQETINSIIFEKRSETNLNKPFKQIWYEECIYYFLCDVWLLRLTKLRIFRSETNEKIEINENKNYNRRWYVYSRHKTSMKHIQQHSPTASKPTTTRIITFN